MSEHLPVSLKLQVNYSSASDVNNNTANKTLHLIYNTLVHQTLTIKSLNNLSILNYFTHEPKAGNSQFSILINDINGRIIYKTTFNAGQNININTANYICGMYFIRIMDDNVPLLYGKFIKISD